MSEMNSTVSVLPSAAAAEAVRGRLEAANIACTVVAADGAFRLQVADGDFTRAMQLLFPLPTAEQTAALTAPGGGPWKCSHCGEEVQPVSDVCWACGTAREGTPGASAPQVAAPPFVAPPPMMPPSSRSGSPGPLVAPQSFASAPFASSSLDPAAIAAESFNAALPVPEAFAAAELARSAAAAAAPVAHVEPLAASSAGNEAAETSASTTEAKPKLRPRRPVEIEEPNPWLEPRLLVLWALLGVAVCVIIWLALR